jgi:dephospho-CoA kinase
MARDRLSEPEARARLRAQMPIEQKKSLATLVINNSGSLEATRAQTLEVCRQLMLQAGRQLQ